MTSADARPRTTLVIKSGRSRSPCAARLSRGAVATVDVGGRPYAVAGSSDDKTVRVWDLTGGQHESLTVTMPVDALTVGPSGHLVVGFGHEAPYWPVTRWAADLDGRHTRRSCGQHGL